MHTLSWKPLDTSRHSALRLQEGCAQLKTAPGRGTWGHLTVSWFSLPQEEMQNFTLATLKSQGPGTSLVVWRLRTHLPMQGTRVRSLV